MIDAIITKFTGPATTTQSRIIAKAGNRRCFWNYDHSLSVKANHIAAREAFILKHWPLNREALDGQWITGDMPNGYAHVLQS